MRECRPVEDSPACSASVKRVVGDPYRRIPYQKGYEDWVSRVGCRGGCDESEDWVLGVACRVSGRIG